MATCFMICSSSYLSSGQYSAFRDAQTIAFSVAILSLISSNINALDPICSLYCFKPPWLCSEYPLCWECPGWPPRGSFLLILFLPSSGPCFRRKPFLLPSLGQVTLLCSTWLYCDIMVENKVSWPGAIRAGSVEVGQGAWWGWGEVSGAWEVQSFHSCQVM